MLNELLKRTPKEIATGLESNPDNPYKRMILSSRWIPPERMPYLFHTANSDGINEISPALCQSFDYRLNGEIIPVTYALPWPHANRVKGASEVWGQVKREAHATTRLPYTYLTMREGNGELGQIRMGSTMLDQYLLAARNSGLVFEISLVEVRADGSHKPLKEYISLMNLPVIDAYQFKSPSPVARATSSVETHLPVDIARPEFAGYHDLREYLEVLKHSAHRTLVTEVANRLVGTKPNETMRGIFDLLVEENAQAVLQVREEEKRIFVVLKPALNEK